MPTPLPDLVTAAKALEMFAKKRLTSRVAALETAFAGQGSVDAHSLLGQSAVTHELLASAYQLKRVAGEINVVIHAIGILLCLPHILEPDERVEYLSLGAGNTGKAFDLETNLRVAEFKFIHWRGADAVRQNGLFKDIYLLAEHVTTKRKFMYVLETGRPLDFLRGGRALSSVMAGNKKLRDRFQERYGDQFATVGDYFSAKGAVVALVSVAEFLPELSDSIATGEDDASAGGSDFAGE